MESLSVQPEFYVSLVFNSSDLISILNPEGVYKYVSNSAEAILGYSPEDLVGKSALDFIHPDELPLALEALGNLQGSASLHVPPFRFKAKNGDWRWMDCVIKDMTSDKNVNGIVSNARDITETVEAERRLEKSEAYYSSLFFNHPDAVYALNAEGYFETVNKGIEEILGFQESEIIGRHFRDFLLPESYDIANHAFTEAFSGHSNNLEIAAVHKQKSAVWLSATVVPIILYGQIVGVHGIAKDITEIKKAQTTIKEQADLLCSVFGSITEGFFVVDKAWRIMYANPFFITFFGLQVKRFMKEPLWEVLPELKVSRFYETCQQAESTGKTVHFQDFFPERQQFIRFAVYPFSGGFTIYFVDITEQRKREQELFDLSLVAGRSTNGVVIMNAQGKIEWVNDGFCRITGYSRDEVVGQVPSKLLQGPETDPEVSALIYQKYAAQVPFSQEVLNYKKNGEILWFHIDVTPVFDEQGQLIKYVAIENDITEAKKNETEMLRLNESLMRRNQDLQQFTYIVSHNLRAPVANLLGLSRLLNLENKHSERFDNALSKLSTAATHLDMVVNDLSKIISSHQLISSGKQDQVNVYTILNEVVAGLREQLEAVNGSFRNRLAPELNLPGKTAYFYSVFNNLITNAIKYSDPVRRLEICVDQEVNEGKITILFADNGIGMDLGEIKDQLFQLYKRFHTGPEGRGIGLYLVKTQIETMGGTISVASEPGVGTTFLMTFSE